MSEPTPHRNGGTDPGRHPEPRQSVHGSAPTPDPIAPTAPSAEPADMPQEALLSGLIQRELVVDGVRWIAYLSGGGSYGTGHWGLAPIEAVHFAPADRPDVPELEALLPARRLEDLFETELLELFRGARAIVRPEPGMAAPAPRRFSLEEDLP